MNIYISKYNVLELTAVRVKSVHCSNGLAIYGNRLWRTQQIGLPLPAHYVTIYRGSPWGLALVVCG